MKKYAARLASTVLALVLVAGVFVGVVQVQARALEPRPPDAILKQGIGPSKTDA